MPPHHLLSIFLTVTASVLGASIGSFLNVVIYRLPREDCQVHKPTRSFCPNCKDQIPWYLNIPVFSWLFLLGKCRHCKQPISWRYPGIELLTAVFFVWIWVTFGGMTTWPIAVAYWVMICIFISATFIDFELMIIPDELTIGGTVVGILATAVVPTLMGPEFADRHFHAIGWSIFGAFVGYGLLWAVISMGKLAFGRRAISFDGQQEWIITEHEGEPNPILEIGEKERIPLDDIFSRASDRLRFSDGEIAMDHGEAISFEKLVFHYDHFFVDEQRFEFQSVKHLKGNASSVVMSREAMGFGDAKFEACIGAFLGWQAVPFSLFAGSLLGCVVWMLGKLLRKDAARQLPFGPYLAGGAIIWLFWGQEIIQWYMGLLR